MCWWESVSVCAGECVRGRVCARESVSVLVGECECVGGRV